MSAATSTIIAAGLVGGGIAANIYGAHKAAGASKEAAAQQAQSAQQALALQREMYGQTRADLGPYRGAGGQSLTALTSFLGLPGQPAAATGDGKGLPPEATPTGVPGEYGLRGTLGSVLSGGGGGVGAAFGGALSGARGALPRQLAPQGGGAARAGIAPSAPGMVLLRAPTGQTQAVPADQVAFYLARGATQV